jgi:hypothetical protein
MVLNNAVICFKQIFAEVRVTLIMASLMGQEML